jgi:molybdopterin/thiamine biosynthesis adenylyltransferase
MSLDTSRIDYLLHRSAARELAVAVVGLGSGGAAVLQNLAMCGLRRWSLFDPDVLDPSNLVKHPALRRDIGRPKVDIMTEWLRDRNPDTEVAAYPQDVFEAPGFDAVVTASDLVICAVDNRAARSFVNERCVAVGTSCVTGSVMRTGVGGEVYAYVPGVTGCFVCLERFCDLNHRNLDDLIPMMSEENTHRYGLNELDFAASGLIMDISIIASLHAMLAVSVLLGGSSEYIDVPRFNWLVMGLRTLPGVFDAQYVPSRLLLGPRADCPLSCGSTTSSAPELEYSAET